jgi:general L-amino acid transport system ATP-binding protein
MSSQPEAPQLEISDEVVIKIRDMHKWYGSFHVLKNVNLEVNRGERIVICGPSGSGKSTLIRCISRAISLSKMSS